MFRQIYFAIREILSVWMILHNNNPTTQCVTERLLLTIYLQWSRRQFATHSLNIDIPLLSPCTLDISSATWIFFNPLTISSLIKRNTFQSYRHVHPRHFLLQPRCISIPNNFFSNTSHSYHHTYNPVSLDLFLLQQKRNTFHSYSSTIHFSKCISIQWSYDCTTISSLI